MTFTQPPLAGRPASDYSINLRSAFRTAVLALAFVVTSVALRAQMTADQRRVDFESLAAAVTKGYAPYQWKKDIFGFDAMLLKPWLDRAAAATDDMAFYELQMEYIASLKDLHSGYYLPSDFTAELPLWVDLYDGKPLIELIDRASLPASKFPFEVGDEVVSVDGVTPEAWIAQVSKLQTFANERATRRWALDQIAYRQQATFPRAAQIGATATLVVRRMKTGAEEIYQLPWTTTGTPLTKIGPVPTPSRASLGTLRTEDTDTTTTTTTPARTVPHIRRTPEFKRLRGFGALAPVYAMPDSFVRRAVTSSLIYSGWFQASGYRIGFIRLPSFPSDSAASMLRVVDSEVAWMRNNTDALIVDVMRNPGGDVCLTNNLLRRFIYYPFRTVGDSFRPTLEIVQWFRKDLQNAIDYGEDEVTLAYLGGFLRDIETAYSEYRGMTGPLPTCGLSLDLLPTTDSAGNLTAYTKPMIVLIDEFSTSSADVFPSIMQDAGRALMVGQATAGGGGLSLEHTTGFYSEGKVSLSISMGMRARPMQLQGFPSTLYIENVGAQPDIRLDLMTKSNLLNNGADFVAGFTQAIVDQIIRSATF
jgi:hypothetical protein